MQTIHDCHRPALCRTSPRFIAASLCAIAFAWAATAPVAQAKTKEGSHSAHVTPAKAKKQGKVKFENGSGESSAERDRRLMRECKGRPNAGACLGYTG